MKKIKKFAPLLALTALSACSQSDSVTKSEPDSSEITGDKVIENIMSRTSVRSYTAQPIEPDKIETLLKAGMAAPSAVNKQPWHFYAITDKKTLQALSEANPNAHMVAKTPLAIVVCGNMDLALEGTARAYWIQDCSAATENILLAANGLGLGAVWTGTYPSQERCDAVRKALSLPSNLIPLNTIAIGYPDSGNTPKDKWDPAKVTYISANDSTPS